MTARAYRSPDYPPTMTSAQERAQRIQDKHEVWFERQIDRLDARLMGGEIGQPAYDIEFLRLADKVEELIHDELKSAGLI